MARAETTPGGPDSRREEHARIRRIYEETYLEDRYRRRWSGLGPRLIHQGKWERLRPLLTGLGFPRPGARVLDLGAGSGVDCEDLDHFGWDRTGILALDLLERDVRKAHERLPWLSGAVGDAARLPLGDEAVDLVFQSTMISSVVDDRVRAAIYAESARVLKRGGAFVSYDMRYPNPWNPHTRPVRAAELRRAFPGWRLTVRSLTLLPPLLRRMAPLSLALCRMAEGVAPLRSHLLACAVKP